MIKVVGIGPGNLDFLTVASLKAIQNANLIYGHERQIEAISTLDITGEKVIYDKITELKALLLANEKKDRNLNIVILASGEPSLFGIAKYIKTCLNPEDEKNRFEVLPGISSVQYLFAKAKLSMNNVFITSSHGKSIPLEQLNNHDKIAFLTDKEKGPAYIADMYQLLGEDPHMIIGENLSYPNEKIDIVRTSTLDRNRSYEMCVVLIIKGDLYE